MLPVKPNLMTNFFASRHMRHYIHCEDYSVRKAPQVRAQQLDILRLYLSCAPVLCIRGTHKASVQHASPFAQHTSQAMMMLSMHAYS